MSKLEYTVEDFVLDPDFRKWVLSPDAEANTYWEEYLKKNPSKYRDVKLARTLVLNVVRPTSRVNEDRIESTWKNIDQATKQIDRDILDRKVVPLNSYSTLQKHEREYRVYSQNHQFYRVAGILLLAFTLAIAVNIMQPHKQELIVEIPVIYEEHYAPPGVKSNLTLQDGSKVILNSGSTLRYIKNFEGDQRELELIGEAYFDVAQDSLRPFMVKTGAITTRALGTSFNIRAYENEELNISLLTGSVAVDMETDHHKTFDLLPGEALSIDPRQQQVRKQRFDEEILMAWTRKTIIFEHAPITDIKRVLENWYGVEINFANRPAKDLIVSGVFRDQTLENVLEGLSYSARFEFNIEKDQVTLTFK